MNNLSQPAFLPMTAEELQLLGWDSIDILLVSGDAYIDHPSFGTALLGRWLIHHGFRVGVIAQPLWTEPQLALQQLESMGRPLLFAGVNAGAIDSMLAHYTAFRKRRHDDAYSPGGKTGARPNRAIIHYTGLVRQAFPNLPVVIGGIEASLRRAVHYDFWTNQLRRPILADSKADILIYGMGEQALLDIARRAQTARCEIMQSLQAEHVAQIHYRKEFISCCSAVKGIGYLKPSGSPLDFCIAEENIVKSLPSFEQIQQEPYSLMTATLALEEQIHLQSILLTQDFDQRTLVLTPPATQLTEVHLDELYGLPYSRLPHPNYSDPIPAWEMIRTSITTHRGCGGGCSFCSLALHQGRRITSRSEQSILDEVITIAGGVESQKKPPKWAGSISDVGGPSANMWQAKCNLPASKKCKRSSCMVPEICHFFHVDQSQGVRLLRKISRTTGVRHVRIASGVRFDLALQDPAALFAYTTEFTGGQLKIAPEHCVPHILKLMRKPSITLLENFLTVFHQFSENVGKEQYTIPYLLSAFPGCTLQDMKSLAKWLKLKNWRPQQVQCFIPTPGTLATAMFYAEAGPDGKPLYVAKTDKERMQQHYELLPTQQSGQQQDKRIRHSQYAKKRPQKSRKNKTLMISCGQKNLLRLK